MDPRLLQYYNLELQHLHEMGAEFAQEFPKIAARLGMNGLEVADPYVERLIEGFGFLAARVHLKLDAEFPRFTQALLETIYPHYLAPTPSMLVAQCTPDPNDTNLARGITIPRGSAMQAQPAGENGTECEFRTAQDVSLWPIEIVSASYFSFAPDLPLNTLIPQRIRGGVRIRLRTTAGLKFAQTSLDRLRLYLTGRDEVANQLYELCMAAPVGALAVITKGTSRSYDVLPASSIQPVGFEDKDAVLPVTLRSFQGYRLVQEYFSFPERFRFLDLTGLAPIVSRVDATELELVVVFGRGDAALESLVDASNFALFCTPAINLFPKRAERIQVSDSDYEYHVVADRPRPQDFEVYQVTTVVGHTVGAESEQKFLPLYAAYSSDEERRDSAYFTARREPRRESSTQKLRGTRSSYIGSEVFLGLVDSAQAPFSGDLRQLSIQTLCTNRDLPLHMPVGIGPSDFSLDIPVPVVSVRVISGPSRAYAPLADGAVSWRAISHLSMNYLSLMNSTNQEGAAGLRDLLELYAAKGDASARKQIDGIKSVQVNPVIRRLPQASRAQAGASSLAFGRGLEIALEVDELAFQGGSAHLLGSVLNQFFSRYVSINSFTETVLRSQSRGEISRWVPQWGVRPTL
jgi:type VI secretion system protein ImpG